jgi:phosphoribosylformylglycinamidine synthase
MIGFNNEFGRPNILGYFRTYEQATADGDVRGYHKPIMLAGGLGHIQAQPILRLETLNPHKPTFGFDP